MKAKNRSLVVRITDLSDSQHTVDVSGRCKQGTALALLAVAMRIFTKTSGLSFDEAVQELSGVMGENELNFDPLDFAVHQ
jgi:hypothetical protein